MFNNKIYKPNNIKKLNKFFTIFIITLSIILLFLTFTLYKNIKSTFSSHSPTTQNIAVKNKTSQEIQKWNEKVNNFQNKINQTNKLIVLEGTTDITATFDNKEYDGEGNTLAWIKNKLSELKSKQLTVNTKYKFAYSYDLTEAQITNLNNGKLHIKLYQSRLRLEYVTEVNYETILSSENGIFASQFTPQQVSAIMNRVHTYVWNNVGDNSKIRLKAIEYTKDDLLNLANGFGFKNENINMEIVSDYLIDNNDALASNIVYNN